MKDLRVLRTLWEHCEIGLAYVSSEGIILECNHAFSRIVGYTVVELAGKHFRLITHPGDTGADEAMLDMLVAKEISHYELLKKYIHKNGHAVPVKLIVYPIEKDDGTVEYLLAQVIESKTTYLSPSVLASKTPTNWGKVLKENKDVVVKVAGAIVAVLTSLALLLTKLTETL